MLNLRAQKKAQNAFINPCIVDGLAWNSYIEEDDELFEIHQQTFMNLFQIENQMMSKIKRKQKIDDPFVKNINELIKEIFDDEDQESYDIEEKVQLCGKHLLINNKKNILKNWFHILDYQLLKRFLENFEYRDLLKSNKFKTKIEKKSTVRKILERLNSIKKSMSKSPKLEEIRVLTNSESFLKISHLLYKNKHLFQLKVNLLLSLKEIAKVEIILDSFLSFNRSLYQFVFSQTPDKSQKEFTQQNQIVFEHCFENLSSSFQAQHLNLYLSAKQSSRLNH
jgi:hypothetical protein